MRETIGSPSSIIDDLKSALEGFEWDGWHFGKYLGYIRSNAAGTAHYFRLNNGYEDEVASTIESYSNGNEATFTAMLEKNGGVNLLDISVQDYDNNEVRVVINSQAEGNAPNIAGLFFYSTDSRDEGAGVRLMAHLGLVDGEFEIRGNFNPFEDDAQNLGSADLTWSNAFIGYVKAAAVKVTGSYRFDDGTTIYPGVSGSFTLASGKIITVKGGIITSIV